MTKKKKKHNVPISHSNLTDEEGKKALQDPNVFVPSERKAKNKK